MAQPHQETSTHFNHADLFTLLNEVWTSQFLHLARRDLRQAADPFFVEVVKVATPGQDLSGLAPVVPSLKSALADHQADIAGGRVTLHPPKRAPADWYDVFRRQSVTILKLLRAPVRPTEAKLVASEMASVGARPEGKGHPAPSRTKATGSSAGAATNIVAPQPPTASAPQASTASAPQPPTASAPLPPSTPAPVLANAHALSSLATGWELPARFVEAVGPAFPQEALAPWQRDFVEQLAEQTQVHADAPAVWMLAALGAAAAKGVVVEVQPSDLHPTNLWMAAVMSSGGGKTPTLEEIRRPFDEKQAELRAVARSARARRETELRVTRRRLRHLEKEAANTDDPDERETLLEECAAIQTTLFSLERLTVPSLTTGDPTQASVTQLLDENDGKLLLVTDEGDQLFGRMGGGEGIEAMLQAHSGATIERTRAGRHEIRVVAPSLSIAMGIQPGPFARIMGTRAYHDKGFLARMLFVVLDTRNGTRKQQRSAMTNETRDGYRRRIRRLLELSSSPAATLQFSAEALSIFSRFGARVDREIATGGLAGLQEWGQKLRSLAARMAGILHAADHVLESLPTQISAETVTRAIQIAEYFEAHAVVAYGDAIRSAQDESAKRVWRWVSDARLRRFKHAEAVRALNGRLGADEVADALDRLVDEGYLRVISVPRGTRGRPSKAMYRVNPLLVEPTEETEETRSDFPEPPISSVSSAGLGKRSDDDS